MKKFPLLILFATLVAALAHAQTASPPNVLFILVDDLGYGDLSSYGAKDLRTPQIDQLMEESLRFNQFYANCTVCSPTRAALLTGRYQDIVGVPGVIRQWEENSWGYLDPNAITLPDMLKGAGYNTAIIGKWHLGFEAPNIPNERGFDFFHGFLGDMMDDYWTHLRGDVNWMRHNREIIEPEGHATELFTQWTIDYFKEQSASPEPFFLYLAYNAPHFPIQPPQDWLDRVREREPQLSEDRAKNVAFVEHLDHNIGRVLQSLEDSGMADDTIVIFSSDNGGALRFAQSNGNLKGGKQDHWEGGIRVATCIRWPGKIAPRETNQVAITMDVYPTLCDVAGIDIEHEIDGVSLLPFITKGDNSSLENRALVWVRREGGNYHGRAYYAIREGDWKYEQSHPFEPMELYNLSADPLEENPVVGESAIEERLQSLLRLHIQEAGITPWQNQN